MSVSAVLNGAGVAIIGCGLIGRRRASALPGCRLAVCCDSVFERAEALARTSPGASAATDWQKALEVPGVEIAVVATTHDMLAEIARAAAAAGKHVLVEKPGARRASELQPVIEAAARSRVVVRAGFNHRFHPAFLKARQIFESGALGDLMFIRGRYGHGGRLGYEQEWRAEPGKSGGGELIDQGSHLIDLARWFLGDFTRVRGSLPTFFWNMPVEDNAFLLLETVQGRVAFLHASWTEWKNLFSFEIVGSGGKLEISGLGGSYGVERLTYYRMLPEWGPPETTIWEFPGADRSWEAEFTAFLEDIRMRRAPQPGIDDARAVLLVIEQMYRAREYV